jgi:hypothetical protein
MPAVIAAARTVSTGLAHGVNKMRAGWTLPQRQQIFMLFVKSSPPFLARVRRLPARNDTMMASCVPSAGKAPVAAYLVRHPASLKHKPAMRQPPRMKRQQMLL